MSTLGIGEFTVGTEKFKYEELAPADALAFGLRVARVIGPVVAEIAAAVEAASNAATGLQVAEALGKALVHVNPDDLESIIQQAYKRIYTSSNTCLGDAASMNAYFKDHKDIMFQVGIVGLYNLCKDFFPRLSATSAG